MSNDNIFGISMDDNQIRLYVDEVFALYDRDHNGFLDEAELAAFFNDMYAKMNIPNRIMNQEQAIQCVQSIDQNYDGRVDRQELFLAFRQMWGTYQQQPQQYPQQYPQQQYPQQQYPQQQYPQQQYPQQQYPQQQYPQQQYPQQQYPQQQYPQQQYPQQQYPQQQYQQAGQEQSFVIQAPKGTNVNVNYGSNPYWSEIRNMTWEYIYLLMICAYIDENR